ncbi:hypothetical protein NMG60_11023763 [Bertholletia excelsa]
MCLFGCVEEEKRELGRKQAYGSCPSCGGKVQAVDYESRWKICFLPFCFVVKRKFFCTLCSKRLVLFPH